MAIAFGAAITGSNTTGTSYTVSSPNVSGSDTYGVVSTAGKQGTDTITGVTWNGVSMTKIVVRQVTGDRFIALWGLASPAAGTNNIVVTSSESNFIGVAAVYYTGAQSATAADSSSSGTNTASPITVSTTTVADHAWLVAAASGVSEGAPSSWATGTSRDTGAGSHGTADSNGSKTPAGSYSLSANFAAFPSNNHAMVIMSIAPYAASGPASMKTWNGLAAASVKTMDGLAIASTKTWNGLT